VLNPPGPFDESESDSHIAFNLRCKADHVFGDESITLWLNEHNDRPVCREVLRGPVKFDKLGEQDLENFVLVYLLGFIIGVILGPFIGPRGFIKTW
jgi:hypothetical protein